MTENLKEILRRNLHDNAYPDDVVEIEKALDEICELRKVALKRFAGELKAGGEAEDLRAAIADCVEFAYYGGSQRALDGIRAIAERCGFKCTCDESCVLHPPMEKQQAVAAFEAGSKEGG